MTASSSLKTIAKKSFEKAIFASLIFVLLGFFQTNNLVREKVEDAGLDPITKVLSSVKQQGGSLNEIRAVVFAFDNTYMQQHDLYDEDGVYKVGYTFPRGHIASFFHKLDTRLEEVAQINNEKYCPKAVFVDFDTTYPSAGNNHALSVGDQALIDTLAAPKCYKILLARTSKYNFIEQAAESNPALKQQLDSNDIIFVTPNFHIGNDQIIRRYVTDNTFNNAIYPSANIAMWQIDKTGQVNIAQSKQFIDHVEYLDKKNKSAKRTERNNVNANWAWVKLYQPINKQDTLGCNERSHWTSLKKISLSCTFSGRSPSVADLNNTLLLLGSTEQENSSQGIGRQDYHKVLNFITDYDMSGVDIHANILMTLLHLDHNNPATKGLPQLPQLGWLKSLLLVFSGVFLINLATAKLFTILNIESEIISYLIAALISTTAFFLISIALLFSSHPVWFNWIIGMVLFNTIEWVLLARKQLPLYLSISFLYLSKKVKAILNKNSENTEAQE